MWRLWRTVTGEWCISDDYGTTVSIGGKEDITALYEEIKKVLEQ